MVVLTGPVGNYALQSVHLTGKKEQNIFFSSKLIGLQEKRQLASRRKLPPLFHFLGHFADSSPAAGDLVPFQVVQCFLFSLPQVAPVFAEWKRPSPEPFTHRLWSTASIMLLTFSRVRTSCRDSMLLLDLRFSTSRFSRLRRLLWWSWIRSYVQFRRDTTLTSVPESEVVQTGWRPRDETSWKSNGKQWQLERCGLKLP